MKADAHPPQTIDDYMSGYPAEVQKIMTTVRSTIQKAAPDATEAISYGIPTFKLYGNLVHFGGFAKHLGFYPGAEAIEVFASDLKNYETSKGTIQFPYDQPVPLALITKITEYRVKQNLAKKK